ncbi:hypothetical protein EZ428_07930 [Pedobacter frigiditerrae]|uniref:Antitoxin component YwqK of the YwqJK toxin-antitoxin module n=1 Tax=Pedobacter frigiditerrae TaxID=2530452 RepID=A0A4R0MWS1_9SPHI|nr:hypothetical protein [Pedobacter frigiditerrae]TCC91678.1 hypothetical protein EZ428_07930 [Pedobacter frigiditerrae]
MKRLLVLLCFFGICQTAFTQIKPIYFMGEVITRDSTKATSYAIYGKLSSEELWTIKRFDLYNNLIMTGTYKDVDLKTPHGKFTYYGDVDMFNNQYDTFYYFKDRYRFTSQMGNFIDGKKTGVWLSFYPDGKVLTSEVFVDNVLNGLYSSYDRKGKMISTGNYVNGKMHGEWLLHGGLQKDIYDLGSLKSSVKDKKLLRREYGSPVFN